MECQVTRHRRNLFEIDNARNLSLQELVGTFIPTQSYWRLLSAKHHIVLGARGQGKTALAKMLSHDHLAMLAETRDERRAKSAVANQEFIGIYLPTRLEWVGGLKNKPWLSEAEREQLFQWRLNIASCIAFVPIAQSCIRAYVEGKAQQAGVERELAGQLSHDWLTDASKVHSDLYQLRTHLEDTDYHKQIQLLRERASGGLPPDEVPVGIAFSAELFSPLRQGIRRLSRLLSLRRDCTWLLCLDEAEFLDEMDHRIINSHMRAYPDNLFLKLTTMPYCHYTLDTNLGVPLLHGQDFEYVNMDADRVMTARASGDPGTIGTQFGRRLFRRLIEVSEHEPAADTDYEVPKVADILGESRILDPRREDWEPDSENMRLLEKYASPRTLARAQRLIGGRGFRSAIARKVGGALLLRKEWDEIKGNKAFTAYAGARMAIRCGDDNPRHLIRIFNALLMLRTKRQKQLMRRGRRISPIPPQEQTRAMRALSASTLHQVMALPEVGPDLHAFLKLLGDYMHDYLHNRQLTTDQVTSVTIDDEVSDEDWRLVQVAVGHGLLHPNVGSANADEMPWREGTFHLAYALAPHFCILPRRGKAATLATVYGFRNRQANRDHAAAEPDRTTPSLFDDRGES